MPNNQIMSMEGQLCGMPLAGPESFSQQQLEYLKRALGVDETVLYDGSPTLSPTLSELPTNFERLAIEFGTPVNTTGENVGRGFVDVSVSRLDTSSNGSLFMSTFFNGDGTNHNPYFTSGFVTGVKTKNWVTSWCAFGQVFGTSKSTSTNWFRIYRIVGIHRISGGNQ